MKKIASLILIFAAALVSPLRVFATGDFSISSSSISLYPGETASFSISATNAAGRIDLTTSNAGVATISSSSVFLDNNTEIITVKAGSVGTAQITIIASSNFATYDEENLGGKTYRISVSVNAKPEPKQGPTTNYQPTTYNYVEPEEEPEEEPEPEEGLEDEPVADEGEDIIMTSVEEGQDPCDADREECKKKNLILLIIAIVEGVILLAGLAIVVIKKIRGNKEQKNNIPTPSNFI